MTIFTFITLSLFRGNRNKSSELCSELSWNCERNCPILDDLGPLVAILQPVGALLHWKRWNLEVENHHALWEQQLADGQRQGPLKEGSRGQATIGGHCGRVAHTEGGAGGGGRGI